MEGEDQVRIGKSSEIEWSEYMDTSRLNSVSNKPRDISGKSNNIV